LEDFSMKKIVAAVVAASLLAGTGTFALAQGADPAGPGTPSAGQERSRSEGLSREDFNRFVDARVAAIRAGLKLTADQERLWQPVEDAIRRNAGERFARFEERGARRDRRQSADFMQQLESRSTMMSENAGRASAVAAAMRPLWDTFSEDQKRIAPRLMRSAVDGMGWHDHGGRRGHGEHGRRGAMLQHGHGPRGPGHMGPGGQQPPAQPQ